MSALPHIVAVDDEPRALELIVRSLRRVARVSYAERGDEALALVQGGGVDLVISDQRMPGMSGIELLRMVAEHDGTVGRILLTGYTDLQASVDAINLGRVHAYLHKPCLPADLQAAVTGVLQRVHLARENASLLTLVTAKNRELEETLTALRDSQARTVASERLAAIGRMIAMIVHDLRSPLTTIRSAGSEIVSDAGNDSLVELGRTVVDEVDRLQHMCSELLEVSHVSQGQAGCRPEPLDDVVDAALVGVSARASRYGVALEVDLESRAIVSLDEARLRRVLLNLVDNALDVMPEGGVLRIETRLADGSALLAVSDTGPGIPPEIADQLFDAFVTFGKARGIGLGLAVVQKIVEELGGSIRVGKSLGGGARFELLLPPVGCG